MNRLLSWPLILGVVVSAQISETVWLLAHGWVVQTGGATLAGAVIGWQLRPAVRRQMWLILAITLGVCAAQQLLVEGVVSRLIDQGYTAVLVASLWPGDPRRRVRRALQPLVKRFRSWSTGIPLPGG